MELGFLEAFEMADEKESGTETVRMVKCVKLGRELPGLDRVPWKGEIGKRVMRMSRRKLGRCG